MVNDWIEWNGGECPVPKGTPVDVEHGSGKVYVNCLAKCENSYAESWQHSPCASESSIIAYRLHQPEQQAWDGEGLPPVGCECELVNFYGEDFPDFVGESGEAVKIIGNGFTNSCPVAFYEADGGRGSMLAYAVAKCFRPIRTEVEQKRDEAVNDLTETIIYFYENSKGAECYKNLAERIVEAISIGKIPSLKLED